MLIRNEKPEDADAIRQLVEEAFKSQAYSAGTEHLIVDALREADALTVSLVAVEDGEILGHVAFSPVTIGEAFQGWYGMAPVAVHVGRQRQGIGSALIKAGIQRLKDMDASGCVVLGSAAYYNRFGFKAHPELTLAGFPPEHFMSLPFTREIPSGPVEFHPAFTDAG